MSRTDELRAQLRAIRDAQGAVIPHIAAIPAAINEAIVLIRDWQPGQYAKDDVRQDQGIPYKCIKPHDSGPNPHWTPQAQPDLWFEYHGTSPETARQYKQPLMAEDAYKVDEYAIEGGVTYRCKANATTYPPSALPGSWERVDGEPVTPIDPTDPGGDEPVATPGTLANPIPYPTTGGTFAVTNGLCYSYKGKVYLAKADMPSCVWPPDTGIWQWELVG